MYLNQCVLLLKPNFTIKKYRVSCQCEFYESSVYLLLE